jgi:(1->4)-alpha-D-glucan 1-alpha-D-glucosylmutase
MVNALAQAVLTATAPGVPDTYQGTELWDLSLVDPDNRRPVNYAVRTSGLRALDEAVASGIPREAIARDLLAAWPDGRIKQYVLATLLRRRAAGAWPDDAYAPLSASGERAEHVVAYARGDALVVVPRLPRTLSGEAPPLGEVWGDTAVELPNGARTAAYRDLLTDRVVNAEHRGGRAVLPLAALLAVLPVAVLEPA